MHSKNTGHMSSRCCSIIMDSKSAMTEALDEHDSGIMHNIKEGAKNMMDKVADAVVPDDQKAKARANPYN
uniref:Uncharacterized protein n=1 Tax=Panagrolaimus sp. ES5 TaxID=591445 RepID=A0AC34FUQ9_9BILA